MGGDRDGAGDRDALLPLAAWVKPLGRSSLIAPAVEHVAAFGVGAAADAHRVSRKHDALGNAGAADPCADAVAFCRDLDRRVREGQRGRGPGFHGYLRYAARRQSAPAALADVDVVGAGLDVLEGVRSFGAARGEAGRGSSAAFGNELDRASGIVERYRLVVERDGQRDGVARPLRGQRAAGKASVLVDLAKVHRLRLVGIQLSRRLVAPARENGAGRCGKRVGVERRRLVECERLRRHRPACTLAALEGHLVGQRPPLGVQRRGFAAFGKIEHLVAVRICRPRAVCRGVPAGKPVACKREPARRQRARRAPGQLGVRHRTRNRRACRPGRVRVERHRVGAFPLRVQDERPVRPCPAPRAVGPALDVRHKSVLRVHYQGAALGLIEEPPQRVSVFVGVDRLLYGDLVRPDAHPRASVVTRVGVDVERQVARQVQHAVIERRGHVGGMDLAGVAVPVLIDGACHLAVCRQPQHHARPVHVVLELDARGLQVVRFVAHAADVEGGDRDLGRSVLKRDERAVDRGSVAGRGVRRRLAAAGHGESGERPSRNREGARPVAVLGNARPAEPDIHRAARDAHAGIALAAPQDQGAVRQIVGDDEPSRHAYGRIALHAADGGRIRLAVEVSFGAEVDGAA